MHRWAYPYASVVESVAPRLGVGAAADWAHFAPPAGGKWKLKRNGNKAARRDLDKGGFIEQTGTDHTSGVLPLGTLAVVVSGYCQRLLMS